MNPENQKNQNNATIRSELDAQHSDLRYVEKELAEIKDMMKENQRMLKKIYRSNRISFSVSVLKWVVIIGITLGAFYYVQPVFEAVMRTYSGVGGLGSGPNGESVLQLWKGL